METGSKYKIRYFYIIKIATLAKECNGVADNLLSFQCHVCNHPKEQDSESSFLVVFSATPIDTGVGSAVLLVLAGREFLSCTRCTTQYLDYKFFSTPLHAQNAINRVKFDFPDGLILLKNNMPFAFDFFKDFLDLVGTPYEEGLEIQLTRVEGLLERHHARLCINPSTWSAN